MFVQMFFYYFSNSNLLFLMCFLFVTKNVLCVLFSLQCGVILFALFDSKCPMLCRFRRFLSFILSFPLASDLSLVIIRQQQRQQRIPNRFPLQRAVRENSHLLLMSSDKNEIYLFIPFVAVVGVGEIYPYLQIF